MPAFIIVLIIILIASAAILLTITYSADQSINCPHCELSFMTDLFLFQDRALLSCPFCHRWIVVTRAHNRYVVKKLLG